MRTDHQLVTGGPYRWLRHPAYTGGFLAMIGIHLAVGGWVSMLVIAITLLPAFVYRQHPTNL